MVAAKLPTLEKNVGSSGKIINQTELVWAAEEVKRRQSELIE